MSNKRNAFILVAGLAVGGAASATCNTPSCTGGNNGGDTQTLNNTIGIQNGGVTGTNTLNGTIRNDSNINVSPNYSLISNPNATATSTSGVRLGDVGSTSSVRLGDVGSNSSATGGNLSLAPGAVAGGSVRDSGNSTIRDSGNSAITDSGNSSARAGVNGSGNGTANLTLQQNYQASKAAIHLGGQNATVVVNDCVYARNIALGLSIADEAAAQVTIPLGADMVKGCGELKAELMTINGANAPEATPAQILLGVKTAGKMAPTTVGAAFADITNPANANRVADELALFARAPREVLVQAPAAAAPADANTKSATTVTLNFHGAAAPQATSVPQVPCKGKWVYAPKTNTYSCERN